MSGRSWVLDIPAPTRWLTANDRLSIHAKARRVKAWRIRAYDMARSARLPTGLQRVRIEPVAVLYGNGVVKEAPNLADTVKPCVDGLTRPHGRSPGYLLVPDDSDRHVELAAIRIERLPAHPYRLGRLQLTITDLSEDT